MGARFDGDVRAQRARLGGKRDGAAGADVHQMKGRAGGSGDVEHAYDSLDLGCDGARREKIVRARPGHRGRELARHLAAFGMHGHRQAKLRRCSHSIEQRRVVGARKFGQAGIAHECLEANHAGLRHFGHVGHRVRREAAPQSEVGDR